MLSTRRDQSHARRSRPRRRGTSLRGHLVNSATLTCSASAASVSGSDLCKRCRRIDLDAAFRKTHLTKVGKPLYKLGPTKDWSVDSCLLCQLMLQLVPASKRGSNAYELRSLSSNRILERGWQAIDTTMLAIDRGSAFLMEQSEHSSVVRLIQPKIDPEFIKGWLKYCQDNHSSACSTGDEPRSSESTTSPLSAILSFKVIDCETREIVNGCRAQYVALSYVWGEGERGPEFSRVLPPQLPETIEDAITITRSLGLRYLWIDRFCINQSDLSEVQEQVGQMDLIYNCAYLTIIAVAGVNPKHGLPGVGKRCRQPQAHGLVRGHMLVSTLPDPREAIKQSKWFQRGWTYQEGILSPRRLIFTDSQTYFECSGMYCCEALNFPLRSLHTQNGQRFQAKYCDNINIGMFPRGLGTSAWEIVQRIEEYTRKQLTSPSDILNGISGILQAFARSRKRVLHCAGVPMIPATPQQRKSPREPEPYLREWTLLTGFCGGLCWGVDTPSERREGFPSWSWTGWRSEIRWGIKDYNWPFLEPNKDLQLSIQLEDDNAVDLETFCQSHNDMSMKNPNTLHIATWIFPLRIRRSTFPSDLQCEAIVELEDKEPAIWKFARTCTTPIHPDTECIGVHLCHTGEGRIFQRFYVLVIREVKNGVCERVGFGEMDGHMAPLSNERFFEGVSAWLPLPAPKKVWKEFQLR